MITKFSLKDKVGAKTLGINGVNEVHPGTIKLIVVAAKPYFPKQKIQYEVELDNPVNGEAFMWFYEDDLRMIKKG